MMLNLSTQLRARLVMPPPKFDIKTHDPHIMAVMEVGGPKFYRLNAPKQKALKA